MELIQKQSNQEPRGKVYLGKGSKKQISKPLAEWKAAGPTPQFISHLQQALLK